MTADQFIFECLASPLRPSGALPRSFIDEKRAESYARMCVIDRPVSAPVPARQKTSSIAKFMSMIKSPRALKPISTIENSIPTPSISAPISPVDDGDILDLVGCYMDAPVASPKPTPLQFSTAPSDRVRRY